MNNSRSSNQIEEDFRETCQLLSEGKTWSEVHFIISSLRDYDISLQALKASYSRRLTKTAQNKAAEHELDRIIEDLDAIMLKSIIQFNESLGEQKSVVEQGWVNDFGKIEKPYKVIRKMRSYGATKFLDIYLKALDKKTKLLKLDKSNEFDIKLFLQNIKINDESGSQMPPISSEKEAKQFGKNLSKDS